MTAWTICDGCSNPVALFSKGWYRCRLCGHESLRDVQSYDRSERAYVLASLEYAREVQSAHGGEAADALGLSPLSISDK
jgi:hypothetical protein